MKAIGDLIWQFMSSEGSAGKIRFFIFAVSSIFFCGVYLKTHLKHKKMDRKKEEEYIAETYEKDENGLYPWEVDTDNTANRIEKDAKPLKYEWRPSRGKWS